MRRTISALSIRSSHHKEPIPPSFLFIHNSQSFCDPIVSMLVSRTYTIKEIVKLCAVLILLYLFLYCKQKKKLPKAVVLIQPHDNRKDPRYSGIRGLIFFDELATGEVHVRGKIVGLLQGYHGMHIHESGNLSKGCKSLGGHFNPYGMNHGSRLTKCKKTKRMVVNRNRHVGDLGNIVADRTGIATINFTDCLLKLTGNNSIIGRSLIIHDGVDDLGHGHNKESLITGNSGRRIAGGIIGIN